MISLPEKFLEDVKVILQDEYEEFIDSYNENKTTGLRLNTMKMSKEKFQKLNLFDLEQIPWTNEGFYYDESVCKPGKNPLHEAGVYYLQEPSAMSVVPKLDIQKGDRVLDMCAAPGGKSDRPAGGRGKCRTGGNSGPVSRSVRLYQGGRKKPGIQLELLSGF